MVLHGIFIKLPKKLVVTILHNLFQRLRGEKKKKEFSKFFYKENIKLITKLDKDRRKKTENDKLISHMRLI